MRWILGKCYNNEDTVGRGADRTEDWLGLNLLGWGELSTVLGGPDGLDGGLVGVGVLNMVLGSQMVQLVPSHHWFRVPLVQHLTRLEGVQLVADVRSVQLVVVLPLRPSDSVWFVSPGLAYGAGD